VADPVEGKVVVIAGAGGGIGRAVCREFHESGARVIALYRRPRELAALRGDGSVEEGPFGYRVDLAREEEIRLAVSRVCRDHGTIDVLVNCAGVGYFAKIDSIKTCEWDEMVAVNLRGAFLLTREVVAVMKENGGGVIIHIASLAGLKGYPKCSAYGATKAGVIGLSRCLAEELIPYGIRVAAICPGSVDSPFQDRIPKVIPREKMILTEDVARSALFVASMPARALVEDIVIRPSAIP